MILNLIDEMIEQQQRALLALGRTVVPSVTLDDLLQPNDFSELETHLLFRYEEGVLHGLQAAKAAIQAKMSESAVDG